MLLYGTKRLERSNFYVKLFQPLDVLLFGQLSRVCYRSGVAMRVIRFDLDDGHMTAGDFEQKLFHLLVIESFGGDYEGEQTSTGIWRKYSHLSGGPAMWNP